jgi:hypothetical protein
MTLFSQNGALPLSVTLACILAVPWTGAAVLVALARWLVPRWRNAPRSAVSELRWRRAAAMVGGCALLVQVYGFGLYLASADFVDGPKGRASSVRGTAA